PSTWASRVEPSMSVKRNVTRPPGSRVPVDTRTEPPPSVTTARPRLIVPHPSDRAHPANGQAGRPRLGRDRSDGNGGGGRDGASALLNEDLWDTLWRSMP